jgi:hypothetical protein
MVAVMVVFVFTVIPWLIFMMLKQLAEDIRRSAAQSPLGSMPLSLSF